MSGLAPFSPLWPLIHRPVLGSPSTQYPIRPPNAPLQRRLANPCIQAHRAHQPGDKSYPHGLGIPLKFLQCRVRGSSSCARSRGLNLSQSQSRRLLSLSLSLSLSLFLSVLLRCESCPRTNPAYPDAPGKPLDFPPAAQRGPQHFVRRTGYSTVTILGRQLVSPVRVLARVLDVEGLATRLSLRLEVTVTITIDTYLRPTLHSASPGTPTAHRPSDKRHGPSGLGIPLKFF
jgi:hypothetical protein